MPEKWTGEIIGIMHNNCIKFEQLAKSVGWERTYLSRVLNGHRSPTGAEAKVRAALERLIKEGR